MTQARQYTEEEVQALGWPSLATYEQAQSRQKVAPSLTKDVLLLNGEPLLYATSDAVSSVKIVFHNLTGQNLNDPLDHLLYLREMQYLLKLPAWEGTLSLATREGDRLIIRETHTFPARDIEAEIEAYRTQSDDDGPRP